MILIKRCLFILISLSVYIAPCFTQQGNKASGPMPSIEISGKVIDQDNNEGLEFATISIYNKKDDTVVAGGITDEKGNFSFTSRPGRLYAIVEFIAYDSKKIEEIQINRATKSADLGIVELVANTQLLEEVEVTAEKSSMQLSLDKRVFNVGKDLANRGGSALDILDNVPSVTVDIDGNIELRGNGNVRLLIDGKPSGIIGIGSNNGLKTIPANMIERVEVITNPSAKYEAEGMSGIINIVLKKNQEKGFNGSFDLSLGHPSIYGLAANLNYRKNKFNFFVNYGIQYRKNPGSGFRYQEFQNDDFLSISDQRRAHERGGWGNTVRFGADYYFTEKDVLTTAFQYKFGKEENETFVYYDDYVDDFSNLTLKTVRNDDEVENEDKLEYSITYNKSFKERGHEFTADFRFQENSEIENSELFQTYTFNPNDLDDLNQRSNNDEGERMYIFQADYSKPFSKESKLEIGLRGSLRQIRNDFLVEEYIGQNDGWWTLPGFSNDFIYDENIFATYLIYGNKIDRFSYQIGLRGEYTDVRTELVNSAEINPRDYFNLFPSAHVGYELSEGNTIQLSYSKRVSRPRFWDLNPFFTFSDPRNFFSGNPDLDPEFTDSYELGFLKVWDKGSFNSSLYYRDSRNVIARVLASTAKDSLGNTITTRRPENLATAEDYGLEINGTYRFSKKMMVNTNFNFFRNITDGGEFGDVDTYTWTARVMSKFQLPKKIDAQISANYRAPRKTTQGKRLSILSVDLGFSKEVLQNNGTLTLNVRDLFNSRKRRGETILENLYVNEEFQWRSRTITLGFNYRINQKKKRGGRNRQNWDGGGDF